MKRAENFRLAKLGFFFAPVILFLISSENEPITEDMLTPTFSKTLPCIIDMTPPPPDVKPLSGLLFQDFLINFPGFNFKLFHINEYFIDIKLTSNQEVLTYTEQMKFQIVNQVDQLH